MTEIVSGSVWNYPYLWRWQDKRGETEGRKERPVVLTITLPKGENETHLYLLAITGTSPNEGNISLEIPEIEKRRVGLSPSKRQWIILDEHNFDIVEKSFYFDRKQYIGQFSKNFIIELAIQFRQSLKTTIQSQIKRT